MALLVETRGLGRATRASAAQRQLRASAWTRKPWSSSWLIRGRWAMSAELARPSRCSSAIAALREQPAPRGPCRLRSSTIAATRLSAAGLWRTDPCGARRRAASLHIELANAAQLLGLPCAGDGSACWYHQQVESWRIGEQFAQRSPGRHARAVQRRCVSPFSRPLQHPRGNCSRRLRSRASRGVDGEHDIEGRPVEASL